MASLPDPVAIASAPISAYMSGHPNVNLAYVKHYAKKQDATSATFKSLNSQGFTVSYTLPDGSEHETFIEYNAPVKKREDVRPVLEDMAKEAEQALGMPSSMNSPPNFDAIMKAAKVEEAQKQEMSQLQSTREATDVNDKNLYELGALADISRDTFDPPAQGWKTAIAVGLGLNALLGYGSDEFLHKALPSFALQLRDYLTPELTRSIFKWAVIAHVLEATIACAICVKRGWYSPLNTFRWTGYTFLYGFASMSKLIAHGKQVKKTQ
ncbi:hypothetical protein CU098_008424 [Rhizopus stolonifer]|uniref:DUF2470 domain-containing protein n=1 Tax=Rhizopus stolonifer TaxID=4846 RepID=A0A367J6A9_RHIST|nr:hypothetical protein CU098_008424 [Rhizopus stolonifer]